MNLKAVLESLSQNWNLILEFLSQIESVLLRLACLMLLAIALYHIVISTF